MSDNEQEQQQDVVSQPIVPKKKLVKRPPARKQVSYSVSLNVIWYPSLTSKLLGGTWSDREEATRANGFSPVSSSSHSHPLLQS